MREPKTASASSEPAEQATPAVFPAHTGRRRAEGRRIESVIDGVAITELLVTAVTLVLRRPEHVIWKGGR